MHNDKKATRNIDKVFLRSLRALTNQARAVPVQEIELDAAKTELSQMTGLEVAGAIQRNWPVIGPMLVGR